MIDAYPRQTAVDARLLDALKSMQSALGTWHDRYQWCRHAEREADLHPLRATWRHACASALRDVGTEKVRLRHLLAGRRLH